MSDPALLSMPPRAGIGLKPSHYAYVLTAAVCGAAPAWVAKYTPNITSA